MAGGAIVGVNLKQIIDMTSIAIDQNIEIRWGPLPARFIMAIIGEKDHNTNLPIRVMTEC